MVLAEVEIVENSAEQPVEVEEPAVLGLPFPSSAVVDQQQEASMTHVGAIVVMLLVFVSHIDRKKKAETFQVQNFIKYKAFYCLSLISAVLAVMLDEISVGNVIYPLNIIARDAPYPALLKFKIFCSRSRLSIVP